MILIFGGAYQGKFDYALKRFSETDKKIIRDIDKWLLELIESDENIPEKIERFFEENHDAVIICNDISCGVVPIDPILRRWREEVGRFMAEAAKRSDEVIRLFCGIPTIL